MKNQTANRISIFIAAICLTGCQQVLDRLALDIKEAKLTYVDSAKSNVAPKQEESKQFSKEESNDSSIEPVKVTPESKPNPSKPNAIPRGPQAQRTANPTQTPPKSPSSASKAQVPTQTDSGRVTSSNQVQTIDEDGNSLVDLKSTKKQNKSRVYIED